MLLKPNLHNISFVIIALAFLSVEAFAQLQANFSLSKNGGCSPLSVQFTNTTTGASAGTTYSWDFGNGNTSALTSPGATYYDEKTYTVTLTAKDGASSSTKSIQVTVYKKPVVDFSISPAKGCVPMIANFSANASAGDGTISTYFWDFGDGATQQGSSPAISHNYTFSQKPPTSLTVTNSYGCYTTALKNNAVEVASAVTVVIKPSVTSVCNTGENIDFSATTTGGATLSYLWDFGDGSTSTAATPKHAYTTAGAVSVKLTVTSPEGCSANAAPVLINVANFKADFDVPAQICQNQQAIFQSKSTTGFDKLEWFVDNSFVYNYSNQFYFNFPAARDYDVKLRATYGKCSVEITKKVKVNPVPNAQGFLVDRQGSCGIPVTINYKDTSKNVVKWEWVIGNNTVFGTGQTASYNHTSPYQDIIRLNLTNSEGCTTTVQKWIDFGTVSVSIYLLAGDRYYANCTSKMMQFAASPAATIQTYKWDFGDGSTSTEATPKHTFNNAGNYTVRLDYTTTAGCTGTVTFSGILIVDKPKFDFTAPGGTTICGNTQINLSATPSVSGWDYFWHIGTNDGIIYYNYSTSSVNAQYFKDGVYDVRLTVRNGNCLDTILKKQYLTVLPPFPKIKDAIKTCSGTRGLVRFTEASYKALQWSWDFGDGNTSTYNTFTDTIRHTYTKTGYYKVVLSVSNGPCTTKDSVNVPILLKQYPVLSSTQTDACSNAVVPFTISGTEAFPYGGNYYSGYLVKAIQYGDLSTDQDYQHISMSSSWVTSANGTIYNLKSGQDSLRIISQRMDGCTDTSNFIKIKIHGPVANFKILTHTGCFKDPVLFADLSKPYPGVAIKTWTYDFGDGKVQSFSKGDTIAHTYASPGWYYMKLTVTDMDGCINSTTQYTRYIDVGGPKADFYISTNYTIPPNTNTIFYNNSPYYYNSNNKLQWIMPDGTKPTSTSTSFLFKNEGVFPVKLITTNLQTGCTDTVTKIITVKKVNSAFTYTLSYINSNSCPPVIARFTSNSINAVRLGWSFGDGGVAGDQKIAAHTYNTAGIYRVVHFSYDANNAVDSTEEYIEVKGPYALLKADTLYGCSTLTVQLSATVKYAKDYTWDFGDGTLTAGVDTFAAHKYLTPGIYIPALILQDAGGCTATSTLPEKIIVDSLSAKFSSNPAVVCNAGSVLFTPQVNSLSQSRLLADIALRWIISGPILSDTFSTTNVQYKFNDLGQQNIQLQATSPYGCQVQLSGTVEVKPGVNAGITGPTQICRDGTAIFAGSASTTISPVSWLWNFGTNGSSNAQNPPAQLFKTAGQQQISLVVSNGNCTDTARHILQVNDRPVIQLAPAKPLVCLGDSIALSAAGGSSYQWTPNSLINTTNQPTVLVWPRSNAFYTVKVTNSLGCQSTDSIEVQVVKPFKIAAKSPVFACAGNTAQLSATGADKYAWLGGNDLNNPSISNPISNTTVSKSYTVVGFDNYGCFTDTAAVLVSIAKLPTVNAGPDQQIIAGTSVDLPTTSSNNVVKWEWHPADYLSCVNCPAPVSSPRKNMLYVLTVTSKEGCTAKDSVRVALICKDELVYIPTGFTPNGDNLNDRFAIHGSGIKIIRRFAVFDRWGKLAFERKNAEINDINSGWDGKINGQPAAAAVYVYTLELECDGGDIFTYQGTIVLIR